MSRFTYDGDGDLPWEMWARTMQNAVQGKRGQAILRELREALLALPQQRLIEGQIVDGGEVCALGCLARYRLETNGVLERGGREPIRSYGEFERFYRGEIDGGTCADAARAWGITFALAWRLAYANDEEGYGRETPEERWSRMLRWVESQIHSPESGVNVP